MKTFRLVGLVLMLCSAGTLMAQEVIRTEHGVKLEVPGGTFRCEVQFYTPSIVRVVKYPQAEMPEEKSLAVVLAPEEVKFNVKVADDVVTLKSSELTVTLDKQGGTVAFADKQGAPLLAEQGAPSFKPCENEVDKGYYRVRQAFRLDKEEAIYGIGQLQTGKMNQRNQQKYLIQSNLEDSSPFSSRLKVMAYIGIIILLLRLLIIQEALRSTSRWVRV